MPEARRLLHVLRVKDLTARLAASRLAFMSHGAMTEEEGRFQKELFEELIPESNEGSVTLDSHFAPPTRPPAAEQATLDLLAQAGRFPIRKGNPTPAKE